MNFIFDLLGGDLIKYAGMALVAVIAWFGNNKYQRNKGAKENAAKQERIDHEKANDIRDAVDAVEPVHDDELKFRD